MATLALKGKLVDLTTRPVEDVTNVTVKAPAPNAASVGTITTQPRKVTLSSDGSFSLTVAEGTGWLFIEGPGWSDSIRFVAKAGMTLFEQARLNAGPWPIPLPLAESSIEEISKALEAAMSRFNNATESTTQVGWVANASKRLALDAEGKIHIVTAQVTREQDAASKGYVDGQNSFKSPRRLTSGDIGDLRGKDDAGEYVVASVDAAKGITGWPENQPGYLVNRTGGIPTQEVITYTSEGPRLWWREWRPGPQSWSDWIEPGKKEEVREDVALEHKIRADIAAKRHGYTVPTNGRGVVMLRFDDYPQDFIKKILPVLRKYDLPAYWACTIRHVEQEQPTDWAVVQDWFLKDGVRIWNHSKTHSNSTTPEDIFDNIVGAADYFESKMPQVVIDGWVQPGTGTSTPYIDFNPNSHQAYWDTFAGRLIMQRHGIVNGGTGGYMQPMGGEALAQSHFTYEAVTADDFKNQVKSAQAGSYALSMMAHPKFLGTAGYMSTADFEMCMAWLASERDAGRLMVLTGDVKPALTPGGGRRNDLLPEFSTGALADSKSASLDTTPVWWAGGGVREFQATVTVSAQTVIELEVTGAPAKKKRYTLPAGTHTIRTFFGMPKGFTTLNFWVRRISGGAATLNAAHVYAA